MRGIQLAVAAWLTAVSGALPVAPSALAQPPEIATSQASITEDEALIRALIADWYEAQRAGAEGRPDLLRAPGAIDASPGYHFADTQSAAAAPRIYDSLAHQALTFTHEVWELTVDVRLAKAKVRERSYFYAWAAQRTTERHGAATFVLEKQADGRWLVLAHQTNTTGFPPSMKTDPMPDLHDLFYSTVGKDRDPEADARNANRF